MKTESILRSKEKQKIWTMLASLFSHNISCPTFLYGSEGLWLDRYFIVWRILSPRFFIPDVRRHKLYANRHEKENYTTRDFDKSPHESVVVVVRLASTARKKEKT